MSPVADNAIDDMACDITAVPSINSARIPPASDSQTNQHLCENGGDYVTLNAAQPCAVPSSSSCNPSDLDTSENCQFSRSKSSVCVRQTRNFTKSHEALDPIESSASSTNDLPLGVFGFTPAYFVAIMGTGVTSNILYHFPYPHRSLQICGWIMFVVASIFAIVTSALFVISVGRQPRRLRQYHFDPKVAPFMGCWPMGITTIINFLGSVLKDHPHAIIGIYAAWWVVVAVSVYCVCAIWYCTYLSRPPQPKQQSSGSSVASSPIKAFQPSELHATILLPVVTLTVAASSGFLLVPEIPSHLKLTTMVTCLILWSNAMVLSFIVTTIYFWKLIVYKIPATSLVFTSFLPVGFLGQGAYGIMLFGDNAYSIIESLDLSQASHYFGYVNWSSTDIETFKAVVGNGLVVLSGLVCLLLVSFGYLMTFVAAASCLSKCKPFASVPNPAHTHHKYGFVLYTKGFWSMTFPLGTMSLANTELYRVFGNGYVFFRVMGTIYASALIIITVGCTFGTLYKTIRKFVTSKGKQTEDKV